MAKKSPAERKKEEMLAEADAGLSMTPEEHGRMMGWLALRLAMERHASLAAAERVRRDQIEEERRRHVEYPYGIPALLHGHDDRRVYEDARAKADAAAAYKESKQERDEELAEELAAARRLTLGLAQEAKDLMLSNGEKPDIEVSSYHTYTKREWQSTKQFLLRSGYARPKVEKRSYSHFANGWLLEFPTEARTTGKVVLCDDGRLLAVNGTLEEEGKNSKGGVVPLEGRSDKYVGPSNRLAFKMVDLSTPKSTVYNNRQPLVGYIDETPGPDVAAPPLVASSENSFYAHAVDMLSREAMIQDALVGLLITNGVELPIPPEPATTT